MVEEQDVFSGSFDAIVGLAYPKMSERGVTPFFEGLKDAGLLYDQSGKPNNVFSFYMSTNQEDQSELIFGGWNPNRILKNEKIIWHPVVDKLFFAIKLDDIKIGGKSLDICKDKDCTMTPDSGTSALCMPDWAYRIFKTTEWGQDYDC